MTVTLKGTTRIVFDLDYDKLDDLSNAKAPVKIESSQAFTSGTGTEQADIEFDDSRTGTESLDFFGGLTDRYGVTLNFATIRSFYVKNTSAIGSGSNLVLTGNIMNALLGHASASKTLEPQARIFIEQPDGGITVTDSSGDTLTLTGAAVGYDIVVTGTQT